MHGAPSVTPIKAIGIGAAFIFATGLIMPPVMNAFFNYADWWHRLMQGGGCY